MFYDQNGAPGLLALERGDCLELMRALPDKSVDMVLVDPPYGIDYQSCWKKDKSDWKPKILNDKKPFIEFIPEVKRILSKKGTVLIFTRWDVQQIFIDKMAESDLVPRSVIIWDKKVHGMGDLKRAYASRYESIIFHSEEGFNFPGKRPQDILTVQRVTPKDLVHPNEKPVELLETLIKQCTNPGDIVLDNCMGSGSTGVACANTGRQFIGMELDEHYFEIARDRVERAFFKKDRSNHDQ